MIRAIIIDDEQNCIKSLQHDLAMFCPEVTLADSCSSCKEGMIAIRKHQPDLVFLDVEMPWMNGFEMLEIMQPLTFKVIFTTAHDQFAVKAFRVSAVDFLTKPVDSKELTEAVDKVKNQIVQKSSDDAIQHLLQNIQLPQAHQKLTIPVKDGYELIPVNQIIYCRAEGTYTYVITGNGHIVSTRSLGTTEQSLPDDMFERIHHSLLININHVTKFKKTDGNTIVMDNGDELTVARARKDKLLQRLGIRGSSS